MGNGSGRPCNSKNKRNYKLNCTVCGTEYSINKKPEYNKCHPCSSNCSSILQKARNLYKSNELIRCNICNESMGILDIGEHIENHIHILKLRS